MENKTIKITIYDGDFKATSNVDVDEYLRLKKSYGISIVDSAVDGLLHTIKKRNSMNNQEFFDEIDKLNNIVDDKMEEQTIINK